MSFAPIDGPTGIKISSKPDDISRYRKSPAVIAIFLIVVVVVYLMNNIKSKSTPTREEQTEQLDSADRSAGS